MSHNKIHRLSYFLFSSYFYILVFNSKSTSIQFYLIFFCHIISLSFGLIFDRLHFQKHSTKNELISLHRKTFIGICMCGCACVFMRKEICKFKIKCLKTEIIKLYFFSSFSASFFYIILFHTNVLIFKVFLIEVSCRIVLRWICLHLSIHLLIGSLTEAEQ